MTRLFYSVMGEGRGHASRALALSQLLAARHEVVIFASYDAYDFLSANVDSLPSVEVRRIPGMRFHYRKDRIDLLRTLTSGLAFRMRRKQMLRDLEPHFADRPPELLIVDFEPLLPRVAVALGVPYVSLDHQHFLLAYDLSDLPRELRLYAWVMSWFVRLMHRWQTSTIVTAFYRPPIRNGYDDVYPIGPILRQRVLDAEPSDAGHVLSYLRSKTPPQVIDALEACDRPVRVYGLGQRAARGNITFHEIDEQRFVEDLAGATALISAAGNQLLGEALFLGKPILALPEPHHHEQQINAHYLRQMHGGNFVRLDRVTPDNVQRFMQQLPHYRERIASFRDRLNGTADALELIEHHLSGSQPARACSGVD